MNYRKALILISVLGMAIPLSVRSQPVTLKKLSVGDTMPNITFGNVLNHPKRMASLHDFSKKLILLDLWSTLCTACIAAFPKMDALQKEFEQDLKILLVNPKKDSLNSEQRIMRILHRIREHRNYFPSLPMPLHDTVLETLFPFQSLPHVVWLDSSGVVRAITSSAEVTAENIQKMIRDPYAKLPVKDDWLFNSDEPLFYRNNGGEANSIIYQSFFSGYQGGIGYESGARKNEKGELTGIYYLNSSLKSYIMIAYGLDSIYAATPHKVVIDLKSRVLSETFDDLVEPMPLFCYDLTVPAVPEKKFDRLPYLKEDLKRSFNISVLRDTLPVKTLTITVKKADKVPRSKYPEQDININDLQLKQYMRHVPVSHVLRYLQYLYKVNIVDHTGLNQPIDFEFEGKEKELNLEYFLAKLRTYGFEIIESMQPMEVILITDKTGTNQ